MTGQNLSKSEQERQARLSASRLRKIRGAIIWLLIVAAVGGASILIVQYSKSADTRKPGETITDMGRNHIPVGAAHEPYNSNPPTSGPHYPEPAKWGIYDEKLSDEQLVHNLEHGGIWISYREKDNQDLIGKLKSLAEDYSVKVILTYRPENDAPIALAAWGRLLKLQSFDEKQIRGFIKAFINKGPEQVPF